MLITVPESELQVVTDSLNGNHVIVNPVKLEAIIIDNHKDRYQERKVIFDNQEIRMVLAMEPWDITLGDIIKSFNLAQNVSLFRIKIKIKKDICNKISHAKF